MKHVLWLSIAICFIFSLSCKRDNSKAELNNHSPNSLSVNTGASAEPTDPISSEADKMLMESACRGEEVGVQGALNARANPNIHDGTGTTPLMCAASNITIVKKLLDAGAKVNPVDQNGESALTRACVVSKYDIARLLIDKGANVNVTDKFGSPILMVILGRHYDLGNEMGMVRLLIEKGANVNVTDRNGVTPLCMALSAIPKDSIAEVDYEKIQLLVSSKASLTGKCETSQSLVEFVNAQIKSLQPRVEENQKSIEASRNRIESDRKDIEEILRLVRKRNSASNNIESDKITDELNNLTRGPVTGPDNVIKEKQENIRREQEIAIPNNQKPIDDMKALVAKWERVKSLLVNAGAK